MSQFIQSLPFTPTPDQLRSLQEITSDLTSTISMNRLLQGDVGSGKTMVAAAAIYLTFLNRLPSVIMAPTTILANQHFHNLHKMLNPFGVKLSLVTQTTPTFKPADVYIGTHALLHRHLPHPLGLVVIDEQHRFGVVQRSQLIHNDLPPHLLSMTATPIPRTIALTLYSELDLSVIDTLPPGRTPVKTIIVPPHKRQDSYTWLSDQITTNQAQVFVVCPLINDSVSPLLDQVKAVTSTYNELKQRFPQFRLGELHGQLKNTEKDQILAQFQNHQLDILVSTPVIEVGIDIPQATIMIIEAPERFGLAQLHQLRGRVGRGGDQPSYCLLYPQDNPPYSARLTALTQTHSGKELAELDLKLRGPGDLYGLKQSGYLDLKIASLADVALVHDTHQAATTYFTQNHHSLPVESPLSQELESLLAKPTAAN